ncbi:MAG TPA: DNA polymerase Y family protein [Caldimonas sp.]|nr:DNA polymerase Y family protein [Caldimonas sp.]HEX2541949.1 DNA polymerase Y family protein [Caldimonas sp.]
MLWIALHLPSLSLESFAATLAAGSDAAAPPRPIALVDAHRIAAANAAAQAQGVKPGLKRATALALAPRIVLGQADAARDAAALMPVAHAALAFTPKVCLQPRHDGAAPDTVLLEVEASLRYFGGLDRLLQRLGAALRPLGHAVRIASAATARGAALLARLDPAPHCGADLAATRRALAGVPVWIVGPGREHWEALQGMGLRQLGDLLGLPRAGLARRFGEGLLLDIDAALGRRPDPREPIALAPSFESRLELFARADSTAQVLHGASVLLERLVAWLSAQHAFVRRFRLLMHHESRWQSERTPQATALDVALAEPSRDSAHLLVLLRERLGQVQLPAPTLELALQADDITRRAAPNSELFPTRQSESEGLTRLIERLQARLGPEQVRRLAALEDHRPERASALRPVDATRRPEPRGKRARTRAGAAVAVIAVIAGKAGMTGLETSAMAGAGIPVARPVWLEEVPQPLAERRSRPLLDGRALRLLSGPERIEAGWWDEELAERDYFIAEAADGALVWIYRARLPLSALEKGGDETGSGWFLHGRFG